MEETTVNYSLSTEVKDKRTAPSVETRAGIDQDLALRQLIYDLRTNAALSQRTPAERNGHHPFHPERRGHEVTDRSIAGAPPFP